MHHHRTITDYLIAVEMDRRDRLDVSLADGRRVSVTLLDTACELVSTTVDAIKVEKRGAITVLRFTCDLEVNGRTYRLTRELCTPRSFDEPVVIDGLCIRLDAVDDLFEFMDETHGPCRPRKHARLVMYDAQRRICPDIVHPWCPLAAEGLDVRECYCGDDTWLGGYFGASAHGGLDINHPRGTPIWTPIDLDDHYLFNTEAEHGNNRWRGVRRWPNGDTWIIQAHHVVRLAVPQHTPLAAGAFVADGAGCAVGMHDHSHFEFHVTHPGEPAIKIDPWLLFRQMYLDRVAGDERFYRRADVGLHHGHYTADRACERWW